MQDLLRYHCFFLRILFLFMYNQVILSLCLACHSIHHQHIVYEFQGGVCIQLYLKTRNETIRDLVRNNILNRNHKREGPVMRDFLQLDIQRMEF